MSPALVWFLETALIIGAIVATIYLIRRHKPEGLAAVIVAPVNIVTASATRFADWLRAGSNRLKQHADEHGRIIFARAAHPLATGLIYVGLASLWLTVMVFYVLRNATIVLSGHTELVRAERANDAQFQLRSAGFRFWAASNVPFWICRPASTCPAISICPIESSPECGTMMIRSGCGRYSAT